jgi:hypothetical protein
MQDPLADSEGQHVGRCFALLNRGAHPASVQYPTTSR